MGEQVDDTGNFNQLGSSEVEESRKLPLILNGKYFKVVSTQEDGKKILARCTNCVKRAHGKEYTVFESEKHGIAEMKRIRNASVLSLISNPIPTDSKQKRITEYSKDKPTQNQVDEMIKNYIVNSMKPLRTVEEESFIDLLKGLCPGSKVMSRKRLRFKIADDHSKSHMKTKERPRGIKYLCLTADIWSVRSRSFFGITVHWISKSLDRESAVLACHRFKGTHSFDRIADLLIKTMEAFEIDQSKVVCIVTDNGSNFVKSFRIYGTAEDSGDESDETFDEVLDPNLSDQSTDTFNFQDADSLLSEVGIRSVSNSRIVLPKHNRCASHTLALIASTDSENASGLEYKRIFRSAFAKCTALSNCNGRPKSAEIIKDHCGKLFVTPCKTRWISMHDSVRRLLDAEVNPKLELICEALNLPKFTQKEMDFLQEYNKVTKPISQGLDILKGDTYIGALLPILFTIRSKLTKFSNDSTINYAKPLVAAMLEGLNHRFKDYFDFSADKNEFVLSTLTHPFFKLKWIDTTKHGTLKDILLLEASSEAAKFQIGSNNSVPTSIQAPEHEFFEFPSNSGQNATLDAKNEIRNQANLECLQDLADPATDLRSLDRYPLVKNLFTRFNTPISSSAPVERLFSFAGLILSAKRRKLTEATFQQLLLGKCKNKIK